MSPHHRCLIVLLALACIFCTGCLQSPSHDSQANATSPAPGAQYQRTIAQPEESSRMIRMDTDVINLGEVVEFSIANNGTSDISCGGNPPSFTVRYQKGSGQWVVRLGDENQTGGTRMKLKPGESTAPYRFLTDGWAPGRYRIVTDCGISREFIVRTIPPLTTAATPCIPSPNATPVIRINPISNQNPGVPFRISGTTNLPAGTMVRYSLFAILSGTTNITTSRLTSSKVPVEPGDCGTNTWSVEGIITVPGDYFIGVSDEGNTVSAVKRFTVLGKGGVTEKATLPDQVRAPGITTG